MATETKKKRKLWLIPVGILGLLMLCVVIGNLLPDVEPGPTRTPKPTAAPTDTRTPKPSATPKAQAAAPSSTPFPTITVRATFTVTDTPAPAATNTLPSRSIGVELPTAAPVKVVVDRACSQIDSPGNDNDTLTEEYVCFTNRGEQPVDLKGWKVHDNKSISTYTFRALTLDPGTSVKLRTGKGANTATDVYWNKGQAVWNNDGDTVYLLDASGQMVDQWGY
jgi:hypothetical protein